MIQAIIFCTVWASLSKSYASSPKSLEHRYDWCCFTSGNPPANSSGSDLFMNVMQNGPQLWPSLDLHHFIDGSFQDWALSKCFVWLDPLREAIQAKHFLTNARNISLNLLARRITASAQFRTTSRSQEIVIDQFGWKCYLCNEMNISRHYESIRDVYKARWRHWRALGDIIMSADLVTALIMTGLISP